MLGRLCSAALRLPCRLLASHCPLTLIRSAPSEEKDHAFLVEVFSIDEEGSWVNAVRGETERGVQIPCLLIASDHCKLDLLKSGKRPGKIDGFGQEGPSNALSLVFGPDVHAQDVASVLLPLPVYSAERRHSYQRFLTVGAKGEVVRRFRGQAEAFGYELHGVGALAFVGGPERIRVFFQTPETQVLIVSSVVFVKGADCYVLHDYAVTVQPYADRALEQGPGRPLSIAVRSQRPSALSS